MKIYVSPGRKEGVSEYELDEMLEEAGINDKKDYYKAMGTPILDRLYINAFIRSYGLLGLTSEYMMVDTFSCVYGAVMAYEQKMYRMFCIFCLLLETYSMAASCIMGNSLKGVFSVFVILITWNIASMRYMLRKNRFLWDCLSEFSFYKEEPEIVASIICIDEKE